MTHRRQFIRHTLATGATLAFGARAAGPGLQGDLDLLRRALLELHPGTFRYLSRAQFDDGFAALRGAWPDGSPLPAQALALNRFLATLRCGHTYTNFYNQRGDVKQQLCLAPPRLPLHFDWLGGGMVVTRAHASADVPVGSEILALDGQTPAALQRALLPLVRADGHNPAAQRALLAPGGGDEIETFDVLHPLVFGPREHFTLRLRRPDGRVTSQRLRGLTQAERLAMRTGPTGEPSDDSPPWPLALRDGRAVLTMPGWALYNTRWDWRAYLGRVFDRLAAERVRGLVIDLRGNEGGLDCGDEILARLVERPLDARVQERLVRYRQVPASLNPVLDTWDDSFRDWGDAVVPQRDGFYRFREDPTARIEPRGARFAGRVAVLVDGSNHSATFRFIQLVRQAKLGVLVGSDTGGNQRGINGGAFFFMRLPASGLEVDIPLIGRFAPGAVPDGGLAPDVRVAPRAADIAAGRDVVLEKALALV